MPVKELNLDGFIQFLRDKQGNRPDAQYAAALGVSRQHLCDIYNNRRIPGESITTGLAAMNVNTQRAVTVTYLVETPETEKEK